MKVLKFRISNSDISKQILVSNNDCILGLVCAVLSAVNERKCGDFKLNIGDSEYSLYCKRLNSKLSSINFKENTSFVLVKGSENINVTYIESRYVMNETFCNYPALDESNKTVGNFSDNYYFRMLYWDLKFGYSKLLNKKVTN